MKHQIGTEALESLEDSIRALEKVGYSVGFGLDEDDEMVVDLIALQRAARNFKRRYEDRIRNIDSK